MLPSTGYFKAINCPFYESGTCDRPYCHFKHSKREDVGITTEAIESVQNRSTGQVEESKPATMNVVSQVVEGLKPTLTSGSSGTIDNVTANMVEKRADTPAPVNTSLPCVYNPTPIAELKKRHIPIVSYMPTRKSSVAVKRKCSPDRVKPWLNISSESMEPSTVEIKYKPTIIINPEARDTMQSYIPTCKSDSASINSYKDGSSNEYLSKLRETYYPKCKKKREEYVPKKVKTPLKTTDGLNESVLDHFETDFDMMDEVLTCTKSTSDIRSSEVSQDSSVDLEPKFSDDEEDNSNNCNNTDGYSHDGKKVNITNIDSMTLEQNESYCDAETSDCSNNIHTVGTHVQKVVDSNELHVTEEQQNEKISVCINIRKQKRLSSEEGSKTVPCEKASTLQIDSHKSTIGDVKEHKSRDKNKSKSQKDHSMSHKRRDHHGSGKRHRYYSKSSSRKQEHIKNKNDKCSKTENKSINSLESIRLSPVDDGEEENDDRQSSIIDNDIDVIFSTSDSDHDVQEECLKIFQEYQLPERSKATESPKESSTLLEKEKEQTEEVGRKRVAHPSAATCVTRQIGITQQARKLVNPQQKMYERWRLMRDAAIEKTISASSSVSKDVRRNHTEVIGTASNSELSLNGNGRVRIAHVPYAKSLAIEKKKVTENAGKAVEPKTTDNYKTAAQTAKSGVRVAHVPQVVPQLIRPEPLQVTTQKFPLNVRQYYVNMMHDVCVLIYTNAEDAAQRAVKEEHACHERCKALTVYKNSCMLAAHRLRKEIDQNSSGDNNTTTMPGSSMVSHEAVLTGKAKGSWSVLKTKKSITKFRGTALYGMLKKWIMTEQQLRDNGFPRSHPDGHKGRAKVYVINSRNQSILSKVPNERVCSRCGQTYMIDRQGFALQPQNCIYHWGRKFTIKGEGKYSCCQQYGSATGCCDAKTHVWDYTDYENLRGYVKTLPKDTPIEEQGVYALDCEMCYTTQGLELTRITVIDEDCSVVYETLVNPQNPIIDYNTRFSGITEEDMKDVTTTLLDVQATLLTMFSEKTILVGHSLESDFKALKLLHDTVVDTSVMFPHKNGYPQKRALKNLCSEYLRKLIQNDVGGHDSKEDAIACMELILWKAKEEAKLQ
ncbi:RNA exonuclease 1 like protein [Eufriesea mexicana]|nr:RNA exonuclease 1 like protein [Eufriesea mexicana]